MNKADTRPRSNEMYEAILTLKTLEESASQSALKRE